MGLRALFPTSVPALLPRVLEVKLSVVEREVPHDPNDVPLTQWQDLDPHRKVVAGVGVYPFELEGLEGLTLRSFDGLAETTGRSVAFHNHLFMLCSPPVNPAACWPAARRTASATSCTSTVQPHLVSPAARC